MSTKIIKQRRISIPKICYRDRKIVTLRLLRYNPDLKNPHLIVGCSEKTFRRYRKELEENNYKIMPRKPYQTKMRTLLCKAASRKPRRRSKPSSEGVKKKIQSQYIVDMSTSPVYTTLASMDISFIVPPHIKAAYPDIDIGLSRNDIVLDFAEISRESGKEGVEFIYIDEYKFNYDPSMMKNSGSLPRGIQAFIQSIDSEIDPCVCLLFALSPSGFRYAELISGPSNRYVIPNREIINLKYYHDGEENDVQGEKDTYHETDIVQLPPQPAPAYNTRSHTRFASLQTPHDATTPSIEMMDAQPVRRKRGRPPGSTNGSKDVNKKAKEMTDSSRFTLFIHNMLKAFRNDALLVYDDLPSHSDKDVRQVIYKLKRTPKKIYRIPPCTPIEDTTDNAFDVFKAKLQADIDSTDTPIDISTPSCIHDALLRLDYFTYAIQIAKGNDIINAALLLYDIKTNISMFDVNQSG